MNYRKFGGTGLEISEVVFGAGAVGGLLINGDDETRREAIRISLESGINWIDTAANYGDGKSERVIGQLLQEMPGTLRPHVSTKVQFDRAAGDFAGQAQRSITDSLERLQMDRVDLFQVHNRVGSSPEEIPNCLTPEDMLRGDGVADAMDLLVAQGLVGHVGFTATGEAGPLHEVIASGRFASAQIYYNLLNPSAGRVMPSTWSAYDHKNLIATAESAGVAVMVIRVLAAGVIATDIRTGKEGGVALANDVEADERRMAKVLPLLEPEHGERSQVAIRYALRNAGVSGVVVGTAEIHHLKLAIAAAEMGPLPDNLLDELDLLADSDFQ